MKQWLFINVYPTTPLLFRRVWPHHLAWVPHLWTIWGCHRDEATPGTSTSTQRGAARS